jgi:threonine dehydratase
MWLSIPSPPTPLARRVSQRAYDLAATGNVESVLVGDDAIIAARQALWDHRRVVVEHGGATALAAMMSGAYTPRPDETVAVVLCGANTDPSDLIR